MEAEYKTPEDVVEVGHYVGNALLKARVHIEEKNPIEAEKARGGLIEKLKRLNQTDLVGKCIKLVENSDWKSLDEINKFQTDYDKLPEIKKNEEKREEALRKLKC